MKKELIVSYSKGKDWTVDWFSGTGPGGQNKNKVKTSCRLTFLPTGKIFIGQEHRTRRDNFKSAFGRMVEYIHGLHKTTKSRNTNEEVIRTYHEPDNRVKDHASGLIMSYNEIVGKENIEPMINARKSSILE